MADAPWVPEPGERVALLRSGRNVTYAVVDRVLTRDVVLTNGERFTQPALVKRGGGAWGWTTKLLPADDERVVAAASEQAEKQLRAQVRQALLDGERAAGRADNGWQDEVRSQVAQVLDLLDEEDDRG